MIGLLVVVLLLVASISGSAWWAWRHPAALPWLLAHVPGLQVSGVRGSLAGGPLQIDQLDWQLPGQAGRLRLWQLQVDAPHLTLWPRPGTLALLRLERLQAARVQFDSPPPSGQPLQPPAHLRLPIDLDLQQLHIGALQIDTLPPVRALQARLQLGADGGGGGRLHRLQGLQLLLETGTAAAPAPVSLSGALQIGTDGPLAVQADLQARREAGPAWQATLAARGPLARLDTTLQLRGEADTPAAAPTLQAQAMVLPFAPWPLGALQLQTEALDLAALSPRLPQTRLAGRAEVQTRGRDQPAALRATLDNRLPGPWDAGRLPLQQLQLQVSGRPDQTDRLTLDRFQILLGDAAGNAGRIGGQGQWQGDALRLQLQIDGLLPARLHRSAAPLRLGGPLLVQARHLPTTGAGAAAVPTVAVDGTLTGTLTGQWADGATLPVQLRLVGEASASHLLLTQAEARAGGALARLSGQARAEGGGWRLQAQAALTDFDPRPWWRGPEGSAWRRGPHRLQGEASAALWWRPAMARRAGDLAIDRLLAALDGDARLQLADSQLAGVPLTADLTLQSQGPSAQVRGALVLGGNRLTLDGEGGAEASADHWRASLQAPALAALAPLRPLLAELAPDSAAAIDQAWPTAGSLQATLQTQGRWPALQSQGTLQASQLGSALLQLQQASLSWRQGDRSDAPLQASLQVQGLRSAGQQLDNLALTLSGTPAEHRIQLSADSPLRPPAWTEPLLGPAGTGTALRGEARGQWLAGGGTGARYRLQGLALQGGARAAAGVLPGGTRPAAATRPWLSTQDLTAELQLDATGSVQALQLAPGRVQLPGTALNWRQIGWSAGGALVVAAELETIDVASLLNRLQPDMGWRGDLTLGGRIDIASSARTLEADIVLARGQGDLSVVDDLGQAQPLGLTELRLALSAQGGRWQFAQGLVGARIGSLVGAQVVTNPPGARWPQPGAALQGLLEARVANLGVWGTWVPPGWRLSGALDTVAQFDGTLGAPRITGSMRGSGLGLRNVLEGVNLTDGELDLQLTGDQARIQRFSLQGGDGRLDITGGADLGAQPQLNLQLVAERFRLLGRIDRRIVASGQARLNLGARRLQVDGGFTVDEGLIDIGRGDAPTLDSDVRVERGASVAAGPASAPTPRAAELASAGTTPPPVQAQMQVKINLGQQLRLRGQGVDTRLAGDLVLSSPGGRLAINGTVSTVDGRYAAYGQRLEITRGRFIFSGEPGNPRLDVLAIRPNLDVQVGVVIDGQAQNPRIRLYSDPELADYDKLSWLVLGRSPDGLGSADTALLQRAAFALLSGSGTGPTDQLMEAIGLTDFSFRQTDGDTRDTIISLGKQLSRRWYVGYERGMQATTGTWQLIYRVAQRFTLRAQSGSENAIDLIWTWRW